jgi:CheY-like chemotaxis protein
MPQFDAHRVFIIDDDHDIRATLQEILSDEGYEVTSSANGLDALAKLRSGVAPNVILLDLMMPVMDGWQFRAQQLEDPHLASIPVVVLSADAGIEQKSRSLEAAECVRKPVDLETLLRVVSRYCGSERR